jgi:hypothetical protein
MLKSWREAMRRRPWLAIAAAYVVAVQVLLGGIVAAGMQAAAAAPLDAGLVICSEHAAAAGTHEGSGTAPDEHAPCAFCVFAKVVAGAAPAADTPTLAPAFPVLAVVQLPPDERRPRRRLPTGNYQRGPPSNSVAIG